MVDLSKHIIHKWDSLKTALEFLNDVPNNLTLFVLDENESLIGTLTDGDIRRGLIKGSNISDTVEKFMTSDFSYLNDGKYNLEEIKRIKQRSVKLLPALNEKGQIIKVIDFNQVETVLPVDVILMAGGRGERLRPITDEIPKSLITIGNKPIIEHNIDRLMKFGINDFTITIRYLGEKIEEYFKNGENKGISVKYVKETTPLGTIGAVGQIKSFDHDHILIMNSDLFTNIDFESFYQTFLDEEADVCVATIPYNVDVPYAVMNSDSDSIILDLKEKPRYTFYANSGIYLMKDKVVRKIPVSSRTDATDFILTLIKEKYRIVKYPIMGYWIDIGKPEDLQKARDFAKHMK